jgi:hypothetical protein
VPSFKLQPVDADLVVMRTLSLVSLLAALAVGGYLLSAQMRSTGPTSKTGSAAIAEAGSEVATLNLQQASLALEQFRTQSATYVGAPVGGFGVQLARADSASYCVQTLRAPVTHLAGPGGTPAPGAC